jgi:hypothetical protein
MGIPDSIRILYNTSFLPESQASLKSMNVNNPLHIVNPNDVFFTGKSFK